MLVSTLFFALITALVIYLEYEFILSLAIYNFDVELETPQLKDMLLTSPTIPEMEEFIDPTELSWIPLPIDQHGTIYSEAADDGNVNPTNMGIYVLISGVVLCGTVLINQYYQRQFPFRPHRIALPPRRPRHRQPQHFPQLDQLTELARNRTLEEFQQVVERNYMLHLQELRRLAFPHEHQEYHELRAEDPLPSTIFYRHSSPNESPPPPYSLPPPPYSPPPSYSQINPRSSPD